MVALPHLYSDRISKHISYREATHSYTAKRLGIDNTPGMVQYVNMKLTAIRVFEPLREAMGVPIAITSFFRCPKLNAAVKGSATSQHMEGRAMDLDADVHGKITNADIFNWLYKNVQFDQLIAYGKAPYRFVHVSYVLTADRPNRHQLLFKP